MTGGRSCGRRASWSTPATRQRTCRPPPTSSVCRSSKGASTAPSEPPPDFLWSMSSDLCLRLPQLLPRHRREVVLLVVGCVALPHDEDDLQPLRAQRPECPAMRMPPPPLLVVVRPGPLTRPEREERDLIDHVPQRLVAGDAEVHDPLLLPAPLGHRHGSSLGLEMPKRLPSPGGVAQAGPERRGRDAVVTDRQRPNPLRGRHTGEKILDRLPVLPDGRYDRRQLRHEASHQTGPWLARRGRARAAAVAGGPPRAPGSGSRSGDARG